MFHLDTLATLVAATLTLLLGRKLVHSVSFLKKYTIPEPVAGGLLVALALLVLKKSMGWEVNFDMSLRDPLMLAFFATIGLNANIASLRAGGRVVGIFLIVVVGLLVMQNAIGIGMASLLGLDPLMGLLAGSITLSGGHGTGAAWSKLFIERYGFTNATEVAMACATFGLVLGGLIGGPVARYLVKHSTTPNGIPDDQEVPTAFEKPDVGRMITSLVLIETIALIAICLTVGKIVAQLLAGTAFELPTFVCVLFVGVILSNGLSIMGFYRVFERAVSVLGNVSLSLFLAMALMGAETVGAGFAGAADAGDSGGTDHLHGVVCHLRYLAHDGQKTTMRQCWLRVTVVLASVQRQRQSPTCRRSLNALARRTWRFWWCRWSVRSLSISSMRW